MASFSTVAPSDDAVSSNINQFVDAFTGVTSVPISLTGVNDAANYGLTVRNSDATNARVFRTQDSSGATRLDASGSTAAVRADPDGSGLAVVATISHTQTLTNKTLTAPTLSGGLVSTENPGVLSARLDSTALTSTQASVTLTVTSTAYRHLEIEAMVRCDAATLQFEQLYAQINSDTGGDYNFAKTFNSTAGAFTFSAAAGSTVMDVGFVVGSSGTTVHYAHFSAKLNNYQSTLAQKTMFSEFGMSAGNSTTAMIVGHAHGQWRSSAQVQTITLRPATGSFSSGCVFSLYGKP